MNDFVKEHILTRNGGTSFWTHVVSIFLTFVTGTFFSFVSIVGLVTMLCLMMLLTPLIILSLIAISFHECYKYLKPGGSDGT